jgi:hypothetical protein
LLVARNSRSEGWQKQEDRIAKEVGGSVNAGSGAFDRKGDVRAPKHLWELKWTGKKQFTLKAAELQKVCAEALFEGRVPVFGISLDSRNYVILEENDFLELLSEVAP